MFGIVKQIYSFNKELGSNIALETSGASWVDKEYDRFWGMGQIIRALLLCSIKLKPTYGDPAGFSEVVYHCLPLCSSRGLLWWSPKQLLPRA